MIYDCHLHVLGDIAAYPASPTRVYTPTSKGITDYLAQISTGTEPRGVVLVQPSCYAADNSCLLDALGAATIPAVGVAVVDDGVDTAGLTALVKQGIRGLRLNLVTEGGADRDKGREIVARRAAQAASTGLHIELNLPIAWAADMVRVVHAASVVPVLDHMGSPAAADDPDFREVVSLVGEGTCWVKLSGFDHLFHGAIERAAPYIQALVAAGESHCVWGSDWPHLGPHGTARGNAAASVRFRAANESSLLNVLAEAVRDEAILDHILRHNPSRLYKFEENEVTA